MLTRREISPHERVKTPPRVLILRGTRGRWAIHNHRSTQISEYVGSGAAQAQLRLRTPSRNTSERLLSPSPRDEGGGLHVEYSYAAHPVIPHFKNSDRRSAKPGIGIPLSRVTSR